MIQKCFVFEMKFSFFYKSFFKLHLKIAQNSSYFNDFCLKFQVFKKKSKITGLY